MRVIIIGSGQLGSRHLQGVLKNSEVTHLWVIDEWESSLKLAEERANEIEHTAVVFYQSDFKDLPQEVDLCIISGTANVRLNHCKKILSVVKIHFLLLEKILYNSIEDFEKSKLFFAELRGMKVNVNHPRRMFAFYQGLKNKITNLDNQKWTIEISGHDWGLACNALHYVDLWSYLRETEATFFDFHQKGNSIVNSKRSSFIEIRGALMVDFANGDQMILRSDIRPEMKVINIELRGDKNAWRIQESEKLICEDASTGDHILEGDIEYQSDLTCKILELIKSKADTELTDYFEAFGMHEKFVISAIDWYAEKSNKSEMYIPIT